MGKKCFDHLKNKENHAVCETTSGLHGFFVFQTKSSGGVLNLLFKCGKLSQNGKIWKSVLREGIL